LCSKPLRRPVKKMMRFLFSLLLCILAVVLCAVEAKPAAAAAPRSEKLFPTKPTDVKARQEMLNKAKATREDKLNSRGNRRKGKSFGSKLNNKERFADKFEKIAEKSGLKGDDLAELKAELRKHAEERASLSQERRDVLKKYKDAKDSPEAKAELAKIEAKLKDISMKHRDAMKSARKPPNADKSSDRKNRLKERMKNKADAQDRKSLHLEQRAEEMQARRTEKTKQRLEKLWEEAKSSNNFSEDELAGIRTEIDEFIASEAELIKAMPYPGRGRDKNEKPSKDELEKRRESASKMRALGTRRKALEERIRKKEL